MRMLNICKSKRGNFQYRDVSMNGGWLDLPQSVKTKEDIENYFMSGMDQAIRRQYDRPLLQFTDAAGKPQMYFSPVKSDDNMKIITVNYDKKKRLAITDRDIWSVEDRMNYLRSTATYIPSTIDNLEDVLNYLNTNEVLTVEIFNNELAAKTSEAVQRICSEHAEQFKQSAIIEFQE